MKDAFLFLLVICNILFFVAGGFHLRTFEKEILAEAVRQQGVDQTLFDASMTSLKERGDLEARVKAIEDFIRHRFRERKSSPAIRFDYPEGAFGCPEGAVLTKEEK